MLSKGVKLEFQYSCLLDRITHTDVTIVLLLPLPPILLLHIHPRTILSRTLIHLLLLTLFLRT